MQVPEIITPTFVDFNRDAVQAYKNSLERVKDDPELQVLLEKYFIIFFKTTIIKFLLVLSIKMN